MICPKRSHRPWRCGCGWALALFDRNHDGKLDAEERETLLQFIQTMMPQ